MSSNRLPPTDFSFMIDQPNFRHGGGWVQVALSWPPMLPLPYFMAFLVSFLQAVSFLTASNSGQLAAVLLSLGVYTWVEHSLRDKLARILDASIGARKEVEGRRKVTS